MPSLYVLRCKNPACRRDTILPKPFPGEIFLSQAQSPTGKDPLNFVCPDCGNGYPYCWDDLREQEFSDNPYGRPDGQRLFHESLKCVKEGCATHALVRTLAANASSTTIPMKPVAEWKLHDIRCYDGHRVREPLEVLPSDPIELDGDSS